MKQCSRCRVEKPVSEFYVRKDRGTTMTYCKTCSHAASVAWRAANPDRTRELAREKARLWRAANPELSREKARESWHRNREKNLVREATRRRVARDFTNAQKATRACGRCEGFFPPEAMDFHHRDPAQKRFRLGSNQCLNIERIREEIAKCDLLCANCHRIHHSTQN